ncbi:MAG: 2-amino-4-hydroxy-6-hydroxymethyldihydropteridine diphosphokinase [Myxococcota bacterium]
MSSESPECFVALGGNLGDVRRTFAAALDIEFPRYELTVIRRSSAYRTVALTTGEPQPDYWNAVVSLRTDRSPRSLLDALMKIEAVLGRKRTSVWAPRTLDLDLLLYGDERVSEPDLEVPHPRMHQRGFVLTPLAEIAPNLELNGQSVAERAAKLDGGILERDAQIWER